MKKRLFIVGAGGLGRGLESCLEKVPENLKDWELVGFLDESATALEGVPSDYQILGDIDSFQFKKDDLAIIAIGDPNTRENIYKRLKGRVNFFTFIDPAVIVGKYIRIGEGCIILTGCIINNNAKIGKFTTILEKSIVGHDSELGDFCSLMPNVDIGGGCYFGNNVFAGTKATIIPRRSVADLVTIGAGSVVIRNVKNSCTVFGNPAKKI
ncbi:MAG: acetyltransferase [Marinilabiliaceae bacterium]|nr:acetyltransferase [Marinilabiliaceae bacterium]